MIATVEITLCSIGRGEVYVQGLFVSSSKVPFRTYLPAWPLVCAQSAGEQRTSTGQARHHPDEEPPQDIYDEMFMRTAAVGEKPQGIILMTMTPLQGLTELLHTYSDGLVSAVPSHG